jgi:protoheme IX farnesyltransferase
LIKDYYRLTKPGIIYGNGITLVAGFILASGTKIEYTLLFATLLGLSLVIASGCVFNNYIDRDIDALMERTKKRALVRGTISIAHALFFGTVLGIVGFGILLACTNNITFFTSCIGFFVYVVLYSLWLKRTSVHSALIGSISGAVPIVVGYLAVRGVVDLGAVILFLILMLWQIPHSFAIALYRLHDYENASIPVFPVRKGVHTTKVHMLMYTILFVAATLALSVYGYTTYVYFFSMATLGLVWIVYTFFGLYVPNKETVAWARRMFIFSIIILLTFCVMIVIGKSTNTSAVIVR